MMNYPRPLNGYHSAGDNGLPVDRPSRPSFHVYGVYLRHSSRTDESSGSPFSLGRDYMIWVRATTDMRVKTESLKLQY